MNETLYDELARIALALGHPTRLRAMNLLFQGEKSIDQLAKELDESEANTAAHMKALRAAGLLVARKEGKRVFLAPRHDSVLRLFLSLRDAGEAIAPAIRLLSEGDETWSSLTLDEVATATGPGRAALLDLRPEREFAAGHLPGAQSVPFASLEARLAELPKRRRILVYCRGKYCPRARLGTQVLRQRGFRAERLRFGVPEWRAAAGPIEQGGA